MYQRTFYTVYNTDHKMQNMYWYKFNNYYQIHICTISLIFPNLLI
jgi:hypothetical protein